MVDFGTGTSNFAGVQFWITENNSALPRRGRTTRVQKDAIPYGNRSSVQIGGVDYDDVRINAFIEDTVWPALEARVGTVGTLNLKGSPSATALLVAATNPQFYIGTYAIVQLTFMFE